MQFSQLGTAQIESGFSTKPLIASSGGALRFQNRLQSAWSISCTSKNHHNSPQLQVSSELDSISGFGSIFGLPSVHCTLCMYRVYRGEVGLSPGFSTEAISNTSGPMVFVFCRLVVHVGTATWCNMVGNGAVEPKLAPKNRKFHEIYAV